MTDIDFYAELVRCVFLAQILDMSRGGGLTLRLNHGLRECDL